MRARTTTTGPPASCRRLHSFRALTQWRIGTARSLHAADSIGCVLFELDGGVLDMHMDGHRVAFNRALARMGYEVCEGKTRELSKMLLKDEVPLRPCIKEVIAEALSDSMQVGLIAGTLSDNSEEVTSSVLRQLGPDIGGRLHVFHCQQSRSELPTAVEQAEAQEREGPSLDDEETFVQSSLCNALQAAASLEKERTAAAFVRSLRRSEGSAAEDQGLPILLDSNLMGAGSRRSVTPELLSAFAAAIGARISNCLLVGASVGVTQAGCAAGMVTVAVPRRLAFQGSFPGVAAKMEGYGTGYATWSRLRSILRAPEKSQ